MANNHDLIERNETNKDSKGGTELLQDRLYDGSVPRELLEQFQIVFSRKRELKEDKFRIFYAHDLPGDPESEFLKDGGWKDFHKIVFVSNWQMQAYVNYYRIPWSHCEVIENSIIPLEANFTASTPNTIRLCYTSTPHRGLNILVAVFEELAKKHHNVELDIFSSFNLYGWGQRDESFKELFERIDHHPKMHNHGTKTNDEIRKYLSRQADIFVHPGKWPETSCLCLIEAMSAGLLCIHSNFGALSDTAGGMTFQYQFNEDEDQHATNLYHILNAALHNMEDENVLARRQFQKMYSDTRFNWANKAAEWEFLLKRIIQANPDKRLESNMFVYKA